jgi:hypothetical protein
MSFYWLTLLEYFSIFARGNLSVVRSSFIAWPNNLPLLSSIKESTFVAEALQQRLST